MDVIEFRDHASANWDAYIQNSPQSTAYQLYGWKYVMQNGLGITPIYLCAMDNDHIVGVLPLLQVKSFIFGNYLTSMPGGICADSYKAAEALIYEAKEIVIKNNALYLILRDSFQKWDISTLTTNEDHCTFFVDVNSDIDLIKKKIKKRAYKLAQQALVNGLTIIRDLEYTSEVYVSISRIMREMGTPTLGKHFFWYLANVFPSNNLLLVVSKDQKTVGAGLVFCHRDTITCTWGASFPALYHYHPNHLLYWEVISSAHHLGYKKVDLGRSAWNSGTYHFKRNWGGEVIPLYHQYYLNKISKPPSLGSKREDELFYKISTQIWRHIPFPMTEYLGPKLRKGIPFG